MPTRYTRIMTWIFLILSLSFFWIRDFRWGLQIPLSEITTHNQLESDSHIMPRSVAQSDLVDLGAKAQAGSDAVSMAFVALHLKDPAEASRYAELAAKQDPSLTWVLYTVPARWIYSGDDIPSVIALKTNEWQKRVEEWDPQNSAPHVLTAQLVMRQTPAFPSFPLGPKAKPEDFKALADQSTYMKEMQVAFAQAKYDPYFVNRFKLDRRVLTAHDWDNPLVILLDAATFRIPNLLAIRNAASAQLYYVDPMDAKKARGTSSVVGVEVAHFGRTLRFSNGSLIEQLIGAAIDKMATESIRDAAQQRKDAALVAQSNERLADIAAWIPPGYYNQSHEALRRSDQRIWSALTTHVFAYAVMFFFVVTLLAVGYVNVKRFFRPGHQGVIYKAVTIAENYLAILLFISCIGLFIVNEPFAVNYRYYMTTQDEFHQIEPLFQHSYPVLEIVQFVNGEDPVPVESPFRSYLPVATFGLLVVVAFSTARRYMTKKEERVVVSMSAAGKAAGK
jgi:hypothetical protein